LSLYISAVDMLAPLEIPGSGTYKLLVVQVKFVGGL